MLFFEIVILKSKNTLEMSQRRLQTGENVDFDAGIFIFVYSFLFYSMHICLIL